jgi:hypothetical protein
LVRIAWAESFRAGHFDGCLFDLTRFAWRGDVGLSRQGGRPKALAGEDERERRGPGRQKYFEVRLSGFQKRNFPSFNKNSLALGSIQMHCADVICRILIQ